MAVAGCGSGEVEGAGADLSQVGPPPTTAAPIPEPAPPIPENPTTTAPVATAPEDVLADRLRTALAAQDSDAPAGTLQVELRAAAENQLVITFTVSTDAQDETAPDRVRVDFTEMLRAVKSEAGFAYGSVLLIAHGRVPISDTRETDAQVVRAKYSRAVVRNTDWANVSKDRVLRMTDDKPAEIHPAYR
jgi:hypothetical protein